MAKTCPACKKHPCLSHDVICASCAELRDLWVKAAKELAAQHNKGL